METGRLPLGVRGRERRCQRDGHAVRRVTGLEGGMVELRHRWNAGSLPSTPRSAVPCALQVGGLVRLQKQSYRCLGQKPGGFLIGGCDWEADGPAVRVPGVRGEPLGWSWNG